jgi:putative heme-binding domain-containing protein
LKCEQHPDAAVRLQLAICLGNATDAAAHFALARLARAEQHDRYFIAAVQSSLTPQNVESVTREFLRLSKQDDAGDEVTRKLLDSAGRLAAAPALERLIRDIGRQYQDFPRKASRVMAVMRGARQRGDRAMPELVTGAAGQELKLLADLARSSVQAEAVTDEDRQIAIRFLSLGIAASDADARRIAELLSPRSSPSIRQAAIDALAQMRSPDTVGLLLEDWRSHSPAMRDQILDLLVRRTEWTSQLLEAVESGMISASQIDARRRSILLANNNDFIRQAAKRLFSSLAQSDRQRIIGQFRDVTSMSSDVAAGKAVFGKRCATCHRLDNVGYEVGPSLMALTDRSPLTLLTAILDPNAAVEDRYVDYLALLDDGRQLSGMLARETGSSIVFVGQDGKQTDILRSEIEALRSSGKSLMPEGLERDMTRQELADVIAYVASSRSPAKTFPGNQPQLAPVRDDGSIRLLAMHARIHGPTLVFEEKHRNLGFWSSVDDHAIWTAEVPRAATYEVVIEYACMDSAAGNSYRIEAAGQTAGGTIEGTGGWDNYRSNNAGRLDLPAGRVDFVIRSAGPIRSFLMDLTAIRLYPEE